MRYMTFVFAFIFPFSVYAQVTDQTVMISANDISHVINYLRIGGTRAEADALADKLIVEARTSLEKQTASPPVSSPKFEPGK